MSTRPARLLQAAVAAALSAMAILAPVRAMAFEPKVSVTVTGFPRPIVQGVTNLPDGAVFMIDLRRKETRYLAQSRVTSSGGKFASERFSEGGRDLPAGVYSVQVTAPLAQHQPDAVRAVMGPRGEKMTGRQVERSALGAVVQMETSVKLGRAPVPAADAAARSRADEAAREAAARDCAQIAELVNAAVRAGIVTGSETRGEEKRRQIEACKAKVSPR